MSSAVYGALIGYPSFEKLLDREDTHYMRIPIIRMRWVRCPERQSSKYSISARVSVGHAQTSTKASVPRLRMRRTASAVAGHVALAHLRPLPVREDLRESSDQSRPVAEFKAE
jgi:hypothetical protein